jgi:biopolymer transport protein ExbD
MAMSLGDSEEVVSEINVTPLVDVMLVLLVVFIVTAPLLTNAIRVQLPQTSTRSPTEPVPAVTVSVDSKGKVYLDKAEVSLATLEPLLKSRRARTPDLIVHLSADEASNYGIVAKTMSAIDRAGISKLSVLTIN